MRVLVVDDHEQIVALLSKALRRESHVVDSCCEGRPAMKKALRNGYDVIMLDVVLPDMSGVEVCRRLREQECWTPIMLITGLRDDVDHRVEALDSGADDFVGKPFELAEVMARLRALARRGAQERPAVLRVDDLCLDPGTRVVARDKTPIDLSPREFAVLELLMRRVNEVLSREAILNSVWGYNYDGVSNVVDVYIRYLRAKIDDPFGRDSIESIRGVGYRLRPHHASPA